MKRSAGLLLLAALTILSGCNSRGTGPTISAYRLTGAMVVDLDRDSTIVVVRIERNDSIYTGATIKIDNTTLPYADMSLGLDSIYSFVDDTVQGYLNEVLSVILQDSSAFADTLQIGRAHV